MARTMKKKRRENAGGSKEDYPAFKLSTKNTRVWFKLSGDRALSSNVELIGPFSLGKGYCGHLLHGRNRGVYVVENKTSAIVVFASSGGLALTKARKLVSENLEEFELRIKEPKKVEKTGVKEFWSWLEGVSFG
jgi:hypothetical protein